MYPFCVASLLGIYIFYNQCRKARWWSSRCNLYLSLFPFQPHGHLVCHIFPAMKYFFQTCLKAFANAGFSTIKAWTWTSARIHASSACAAFPLFNAISKQSKYRRKHNIFPCLFRQECKFNAKYQENAVVDPMDVKSFVTIKPPINVNVPWIQPAGR